MHDVWPDHQKIKTVDDPTIGMTQFGDAAEYHPKLTQKILELEQGSEFRDALVKGACGIKIRDPHRWGIPEATLIHERAVQLFKRMLKTEQAVVDCCWASIYHTGDYCMPHSHVRAVASVLYMLDPGEETPGDPLSGKFCFVDPRMACCCKREPGRMTDVMMPDMVPGSMLIFPAMAVHCVNPYTGKKPRITMTWNLNHGALAGKPSDYWEQKSQPKN